MESGLCWVGLGLGGREVGWHGFAAEAGRNCMPRLLCPSGLLLTTACALRLSTRLLVRERGLACGAASAPACRPRRSLMLTGTVPVHVWASEPRIRLVASLPHTITRRGRKGPLADERSIHMSLDPSGFFFSATSSLSFRTDNTQNGCRSTRLHSSIGHYTARRLARQEQEAHSRRHHQSYEAHWQRPPHGMVLT